MSEIKMKSIYDLLGENFYIPSYQRGYKWTSTQVEAMMEHIWEFANKKELEDEQFYCLQPIVIKNMKDKENSYEVIDGQQRLTTIYILLKYFLNEYLKKESLKEDYDNREIFSIEYKTRNKSKSFLDKVGSNDLSDDNNNIDFHNIKNAYNTLHKYINNNLKHRTDKEKFLGVLLGRQDSNDKKSVQVIWYEVDEKEDSYSIFSRLNIGKIALTNAELIKALFLNRFDYETDDKYFKTRQIQISSEWDTIEKRLSQDEFWHFIYNSTNNYETKIEYIFDIMKNNLAESHEQRFTFNKFYEEINKSKNTEDKIKEIDNIWKEVKEIIGIFESWYNNNAIYHLIGFIINNEIKGIKNLLERYKKSDKSSFEKELKSIIAKKIWYEKDKYEIENISYDNNKKEEIRFILLLFNICLLIKSNNYRQHFPFDKYIKEKWDIEHIHSQIEKEDFNENEMNEWIKWFNEYLGEGVLEDNYKKIREKINKFNTDKQDKEKFNKQDKEKFKEIYNDMKKLLSIKEENNETDNSIGNLTLLDSSTNRGYKNAWFPLKRAIILKKDSDGKFIPLATKNVFVKAYSGNLTSLMEWGKTDIDLYAKKIDEVLKDYLKNGDNKNE